MINEALYFLFDSHFLKLQAICISKLNILLLPENFSPKLSNSTDIQ